MPLAPLRIAPDLAAATPSPVRRLAGQALSRAAGAPLVGGNAVDLLIDAQANFDAWLAAIGQAHRRVLLENYIIRDDPVGREFRAALCDRAAAGVAVYVICDWLGCLRQSNAQFWQPLVAAGGEVRWYNRFNPARPLGWINRDHRKLLAVDRHIAFLGGICLSAKWLGDAARNIPPWRDTGIAVRGPALLDLEQAFADVWAQLGSPLADAGMNEPAAAGETDLRIIATQPDTAGMFRLDQLIAALAQRTLWLADAYFVGLSPYVQALAAAARDGVDVRLLVPGASDLPVVRNLSRSGYRPLLESGIRVFEWNGSMMHAKTAVADCRWARVGSSNLNVASWLGNCELDVAIECEAFSRCMQEQYLNDLENATEIVLAPRRRIRRSAESKPQSRRAGGSSGRATASALRLAHSVGAALGNRQLLDESASAGSVWLAPALILTAVVIVLWPRLIAWPLALLALWVGIALCLQRLASRRAARARRARAASPDEVQPGDRVSPH